MDKVETVIESLNARMLPYEISLIYGLHKPLTAFVVSLIGVWSVAFHA